MARASTPSPSVPTLGVEDGPLSRHTGPYSIVATRGGVLRKGVEATGVEAEVLHLLWEEGETSVHLWSETEQQFVMTYRLGKEIPFPEDEQDDDKEIYV